MAKVDAIEIEHEGRGEVKVYEVRDFGWFLIGTERLDRYGSFQEFNEKYVYPMVERYFGKIVDREPIERYETPTGNAYQHRFLVVLDNAGKERYVYEYLHIYPIACGMSMDMRKCEWLMKYGRGAPIKEVREALGRDKRC